ncbi:metallopeptidase TldD-related protein [Lentzea sp. BCCO 10_0856]|uniref:Metallopeptidase TldD-related protein n=1 Tax=Lentzea miocenica TaxID=3095431 RepID=A0ABU4T7L6_9PSEU|nr:metallopeptidase TldD-related protein [Lentzea sp. BCCO 10_0856]MDX8034155.1 metallopeptidase TldD-related protein [Lentzea sp. BCCO 10_0856]
MKAPQEIAETALAAPGTGERIVIVDDVSSVHLRWADNSLTSNGEVRSRTLTVIALDAGTGIVSQEGALDDEVIRDVVTRACAAARRVPPAPDAHPLPRSAVVSPHWFDEPPCTSITTLDPLVDELSEAFGRARATRTRLFGYAGHELRTTWLATSTGLRLRHTQPTGVLDLTGRDHEQTRSSWTGLDVTDFSAPGLLRCCELLETRLDWSQRRTELPPDRYDVILSPSCVADLMTHLHLSSAARDALHGVSVFSKPGQNTRVGERLADVPLTLYSDPAEPGLTCAPFTIARGGSAASVYDNGMSLRRSDWITDGVLTALVHSRHSARETGAELTPETGNLVLSGHATGTLEDLVSDTRRGLLLTSLWYLRDVDPRRLLLTGLTRDGVHVIDRGEISGACNDFRFNESPVELLGRVDAMSHTERTLPREWGDQEFRTAMPALRVRDFAMSSVSRSV